MTGHIYKIEMDKSSGLQSIEMPSVDMQPVENMGFSYGTAIELPMSGVTFARGEIAPGAEVPGHAGPNLYGLYVISGNGILTLTDSEGNATAEQAYQPDDLIIFEPNAMHGWKNTGAETMRWLGVDIAGQF